MTRQRLREPQTQLQRAALWIVVALTALSFGLRVSRLDAMSLWFDEGLTMYRTHQSIPEILSNRIVIQDVVTYDQHPPLYFLLLKGWSALAGDGEFAVRFFSLLFGTLLVPLAYVLGTRLVSREAGVWTALLAAASPFYLWHSQEARMYTLLAAGVMASMWLLLRAVDGSPHAARRFVAAGVVAGLTLAVHYTMFLVIGLQTLIVMIYLWRGGRRRWVWLLLGAALLGAIGAIGLFLHQGWRTEPRPFQEILFEAWNVFSLGASVQQMRPFIEIGVFPLVGGVGLIGLLIARRRAASGLLAVWAIWPVVAFFVISLFSPVYTNPRNLSAGLPAYLLSIGVGLAWLRRYAWPLMLVCGAWLLVVCGVATWEAYTDPRLQKDDLRQVAAYIQRYQLPTDGILLHNAIIRPTFDYYYTGGLPVDAVPHYATGGDAARALADLQRLAGQFDRLWFVERPAAFDLSNVVLPAWLKQTGARVRGVAYGGSPFGASVSLYLTHAPVATIIPLSARSLAATSAKIDLMAVDGPRQAVPTDQPAVYQTYWRARQPITLTLVSELVGADGLVWAKAEEPLWEDYPVSQWPPNRLVNWPIEIALPPGLPLGEYRARLRPVNAATGEVVQLSGANEDGYLDLGAVQVTRPVRPGLPPRFAEGEAVDVDFGGVVQVKRFISPADTIRPGLTFPIDLLWQAGRSVGENYRYRLDIRGPDGQSYQSAEGVLSSNGFDSAAWQAEDVIRQTLIIAVPYNARGGDYALWLSLVDAHDQPIGACTGLWPFVQPAAQVGVIHVEEYPVVTTPPPLAIVRPAEFDQGLALLGINLSSAPYTADSAIDVDLVWRSAQRPALDYTVLLQLIDQGRPNRGARRCRSGERFAPDQFVAARRNRHRSAYVALREGLPAGDYTLYTGFYLRDSGERLPVTVDGATPPERWVKVTSITVR